MSETTSGGFDPDREVTSQVATARKEKVLEQSRQVEERYKDKLREEGRSEEEIETMTRPMTPDEIEKSEREHQARLAAIAQGSKETPPKPRFQLPFFRKK